MARFWPALRGAGALAVIGQSGSVTAALAERVEEKGLGISAAVKVVVSTSGGGATLAVDEAQSQGLVLPPLPAPLVEELRRLGPPPIAGLSNPLDIPSLDASLFERAVTLIDSYDLADVCLISFGDPVPGSAQMLPWLAGRIQASLAVAYFGGGEVERASRIPLHQAGIPVFPTPERAVGALASAVRVSQTCQRTDQAPSGWTGSHK